MRFFDPSEGTTVLRPRSRMPFSGIRKKQPQQ